jgi:hypothetical protein
MAARKTLPLTLSKLCVLFYLLFLKFFGEMGDGSEKCGLGVSPSGAPFQDRWEMGEFWIKNLSLSPFPFPLQAPP